MPLTDPYQSKTSLGKVCALFGNNFASWGETCKYLVKVSLAHPNALNFKMIPLPIAQALARPTVTRAMTTPTSSQFGIRRNTNGFQLKVQKTNKIWAPRIRMGIDFQKFDLLRLSHLLAPKTYKHTHTHPLFTLVGPQQPSSE